MPNITEEKISNREKLDELVPYEKLQNPKESFRELIGDENLTKISEKDLEKIDKSIDKRISENNPPTVAEIQNLALRAVAKVEMSAGKAAFLEQTREDINKFVADNPGTGFSKRQYADIMSRAEKSMSPLEVRMDLYKVSQVNNLTNSFMEQMKDAGISVSRRFEDLLAKNIERGHASMANVQNILDKTIERVQKQDFNIDIKVRNANDLHEIYTDYYVEGKRAGYVMSMSDEKNGIVSAQLENKELFSMVETEEKGVYKTENGQKMSLGEATEFAGKSVENAINTYRVINAFQTEIDEYINTRQVESEMKKIDAALFPEMSKETQRRRELEENIPAPEVKTETKEKQESEKEYGGMEL
jgi:hypothetical protein